MENTRPLAIWPGLRLLVAMAPAVTAGKGKRTVEWHKIAGAMPFIRAIRKKKL